MKIVVCGARETKDLETDLKMQVAVHKHLHALNRETPITFLAQGGATGVDSSAHDWAESRGVTCASFWAAWDKLGNTAGPIRNRIMLEIVRPDLVVAFPGGAGTLSCVTIAESRGIPVKHIRWEDKP